MPVSWTREADNSCSGLETKGEAAATEEDIANVCSLMIDRTETSGTAAASYGDGAPAATASSGDGAPAAAAIKKEKPLDQDDSAKKQLEEQVKKFMAEPVPTKLKLQAMEIELDKLLPEARKHALMETFAAAVDKHQSQVHRMLKAVTRAVQGSEVQANKMPAVMAAFNTMCKQHDDLMSFAALNNLVAKKRRKDGKAKDSKDGKAKDSNDD